MLEFPARDFLLIRRLVDQYPELYLDELRDWIHFETGRLFSLATLSKTLSQMGLSIVKVGLYLLILIAMILIIGICLFRGIYFFAVANNSETAR